MERKCDKCKWSVKKLDYQSRFCRRYPPQLHIDIRYQRDDHGCVMRDASLDYDTSSSFPAVADNTWCGEFEPKEESCEHTS